MIPRELATWSTLSVLLAAVEGGLVGVLVKNAYAGVAPAVWVNLAVALVSGAPAFANVLSFLFADLAQGRNKVRIISLLMAACAICLLVMGMAPVSRSGLVVLTLAMIAARTLWSGIVTIRASVWRMNFNRSIRGRITGRIITLSGILIGVAAALIGLLLDWNFQAYRWIYSSTALMGLAAALLYRKTPMRGAGRLLKRELEQHGQGSVSFRRIFGVLGNDHAFARYMGVMMVFGSGNLMLMAPLIIIINEHFDIPQFQQVLITSSLTLLLVALSVSLWARLLDRRHIVDYRARQSWAFVLAQLCFVIAVIGKLSLFFWLGSVVLGIAYGGAVLGWNLGHNDFSNDENSAYYMAAHVTLTGLRGLVMPTTGVLLYQWVSAIDPEYGRFILLLPFGLTLLGAVLFVIMARLRQREMAENTYRAG